MEAQTNVISTNNSQIHVKFITKQECYAVPNEPFTVPSSVTCFELNSLIRELLSSKSTAYGDLKQIEFDFLVVDEFLRTSLGEFLQSKDLSTEDVIQVEYLQKFPTPKPEDSLLHDDWVSAIDLQHSFILSGCYDGTAHIWTKEGNRKLTVPTSKDLLKTVAWVNLDSEAGIFLSGGQKQVIQQWRWNKKENTAECIHNYHGHERSVESVAVNKDSSAFASVGWDALVKIWSLDETEGSFSSKKLKTDDSSISNKTPRMTLKGHRDNISCVRWRENSTIVTSSYDHTLKLWDVEEGGLKQDLPGNKTFLSCDAQSDSSLIVVSASDKHIRLYDPRSSEGSFVKQIFTSHTLWVHSVAWSPKKPEIFVSGSFDEMVKLWDMRSPRAPLYDLSGHTDKVLSVFCGDDCILSGAADNNLKLFSVNQ